MGNKFLVKKVVCSNKAIYLLTECRCLLEIPISPEMTVGGTIESFNTHSRSVNHLFHQVEGAQLEAKQSLNRIKYRNKVVDVDTNMNSAHVLVVTADGNVYSWGDNSYGKLGYGDIVEQISLTVIQSFINLKVNVKQVAFGSEHSLILTQLGEMYACGRNHKG